MIDYEIIQTGSSGNAVLVGNILIDCGVPYKKIEPYLDRIRVVLLTHEHSDHFKPSTIRRLALEKPKLRIGCGSFMAKPLVDAGVARRQIIIMNPRIAYGFCMDGNEEVVIPVEVEHDVPNYAYKFHLHNGKVFYATDMANLNGISAVGYDLYLVEANYQKDEIKARMDAKDAEGVYAYERRVVKYHMAKEDIDNWLVKNMGPTGEFVYLHCHEEVKNARNQEGEHLDDGSGSH